MSFRNTFFFVGGCGGGGGGGEEGESNPKTSGKACGFLFLHLCLY